MLSPPSSSVWRIFSLSSCACFSPLHKTELHNFECSTFVAKKNGAILMFFMFCQKNKKQHDFQCSTGIAKKTEMFCIPMFCKYSFLLQCTRFTTWTFLLTGIVLTTGIDFRSKHNLFFLGGICRRTTAKNENPAAEPHGSPQGCTVRPRKGTAQCSIGGRGGIFIASCFSQQSYISFVFEAAQSNSSCTCLQFVSPRSDLNESASSSSSSSFILF